MSIAAKILRLRTELGLTQVELGRKISISHVQIGRYERGKTKPGKKSIEKLAEGLNVSATYLQSEDPENKIEIEELDQLWNKLYRLIVDNPKDKATLKNIFQTYIFKNRNRHFALDGNIAWLRDDNDGDK